MFSGNTYRVEGGERIVGSWRHVFIRNGAYYLSALRVYADGIIDCWGLVNLATFREKVLSGWVATTFEEGAVASAHELADWRFAEPRSYLTPQGLIDEVADEIERLAGRPTSEDRCRAALRAYLEAPSEERRSILRDAYYAVPEHRRIGLCGDVRFDDGELRTLITPIGQAIEPRAWATTGPQLATEELHDGASAYFRYWLEDMKSAEASAIAADDAITESASVVRFDEHDGGHPYLANSYEAPFTIDDVTYPTVEHAYWALATTDPEMRAQIMQAPTADAARALGLRARLRPDWNIVRLAVMAHLVREKFRQHPDLAAKLVATGDGRLINGMDDSSAYWGAFREEDRNWLGRILELIRAEIRASASP